MLTALAIQNVVLIEKLEINFQVGFCALTGETGAGKSILLDSLSLALGVRAETGLVKRGTDRAIVSATFELPKEHLVFSTLEEHGLEAENPLILRRIVKSDGGGRAFINDQPVSVTLLRKIGNLLVEIHGQFDTQGLLDPKTHRNLLDEYAAINVNELPILWDKWQQAEQLVKQTRKQMDKACEDEDYLRQSLEDLDALAPQGATNSESEEEKLGSLRTRLMHREQVLEGLNNALHILNEQNAVGEAFRTLDRIADKAGETIQDPLASLDRADAEISEALNLIQSLSTNLSEEEHNLEAIDDRLFALRGQARKHQCSVDELPAKREELANALNLIENQDNALADLIKKAKLTKERYIKCAESLSLGRQETARKLDQLVANELPPLKLEKARFTTQVEKLEEFEWGPHGIDRVRFLVATNQGSEPGALNKIASGGEMARFMLALKVVMAETGCAQNDVETLIFDEIDTGIGGATANAVGQRLARLAEKRQILVVTHAPQVAARAQNHFIVMKESKDNNTAQTTIVPLRQSTERREEIARMLAGAEVSDEARAAADKLLDTGS